MPPSPDRPEQDFFRQQEHLLTRDIRYLSPLFGNIAERIRIKDVPALVTTLDLIDVTRLVNGSDSLRPIYQMRFEGATLFDIEGQCGVPLVEVNQIFNGLTERLKSAEGSEETHKRSSLLQALMRGENAEEALERIYGNGALEVLRRRDERIREAEVLTQAALPSAATIEDEIVGKGRTDHEEAVAQKRQSDFLTSMGRAAITRGDSLPDPSALSIPVLIMRWGDILPPGKKSESKERRRQAALVFARYLGGASTDAIARDLGVKVQTLEARIRSVRKSIAAYVPKFLYGDTLGVGSTPEAAVITEDYRERINQYRVTEFPGRFERRQYVARTLTLALGEKGNDFGGLLCVDNLPHVPLNKNEVDSHDVLKEKLKEYLHLIQQINKKSQPVMAAQEFDILLHFLGIQRVKFTDGPVRLYDTKLKWSLMEFRALLRKEMRGTNATAIEEYVNTAEKSLMDGLVRIITPVKLDDAKV